MIDKFENLDFGNDSNKEVVGNLTSELLKKSDEEIKETLVYLIDNKVELDSEVPVMLQEMFHNEKLSAVLVEIESDSNNS